MRTGDIAGRKLPLPALNDGPLAVLVNLRMNYRDGTGLRPDKSTQKSRALEAHFCRGYGASYRFVQCIDAVYLLPAPKQRESTYKHSPLSK
ncbi:hypothetical protein AAW51_5265 [Caldimonas brevitalea]|uniref:Uncharacterized protein n=1 Tax=Caldimonas brevitalea TaxID=413882 RepID=A0A0G3BX64_9BURK|nr:hypothetical protein AAW51_5265 [Caldimonas brevitalea]